MSGMACFKAVLMLDQNCMLVQIKYILSTVLNCFGRKCTNMTIITSSLNSFLNICQAKADHM